MIQIAPLSSYVQSCVSLLVLNVHIILRFNEHLQDVEPFLILGGQVKHIIAFLICIVDLNAIFGQNAHYIAIAKPSGRPKCIQPLLILLVDIDHLVFKHQSHELLATKEQQFTLLIRSD